eukprot:1067708-Amphidinium_carterae.1
MLCATVAHWPTSLGAILAQLSCERSQSEPYVTRIVRVAISVNSSISRSYPCIMAEEEHTETGDNWTCLLMILVASLSLRVRLLLSTLCCRHWCQGMLSSGMVESQIKMPVIVCAGGHAEVVRLGGGQMTLQQL